MLERNGPWRTALALVALLLIPAPPVLADSRTEARRHFQDGMALIREGKYEEGTRELYEAYRIRPHPVVLYNIGRALFEAGRYATAIEELERYLATGPSDADEVERLIETARARLDEEARSRAAAPPPDANGAVPAGRAADVKQELAILRRQLQQMLERVDTLQGAVRAPGPSGGAAGRPYAPPPGGSGKARPAQATPRAGSNGPGDASAAVEAADRAGPVVSERSGAASREDPYAPIVITSSRYGQSPLDAPNAVTILTGDELRASGVTAIPDFLRRVPGLEVMAMSPADHNIGIRGFNDRLANKVLVLVDGRSVYMDFLGATSWPLLTISPSDIERIEIVRGPGAALYGANAFSGVINIITRNPGLDGDQPVVEMWGGLPEQGGASLRMSDRFGPTAYRASFAIEGKRRWYNEIDPSRPEYEVMAPHPDDSVRVGRADLRLDHRVSRDISVSLSGGIAAGQHEFVAIGALRDFYMNGYQSYLRGDAQLPLGFSLRAFWNHIDLESDQWARPVGAVSLATESVSDVVDVEVESFREFEFLVRHRLNVGAGYRLKTARWDWLGTEPEEHHASIFFQDEAILTEDLRATLSLRLDRHPLLVDIDGAPFTDRYALSPRGALVWRVLPGHSVHATAGTAFRTPTFLESYIALPVPTSTDAVVVRNVGNQELLPERVLATELGWRSEPASSRYKLEAAAFYNRISSLIQLSDLRPWPAGEPNYDPQAGVWYAGETTYVNVDDDYDAIGAELGGMLLPADGVDLYASGTYQRIDGGGERIESSSPIKLSAGAQLRGRDFTLAGDVHFVSPQTWALRSFDEGGQTMDTDVDLPAYVWAGARASYLVPRTQLELAIAGQNLLAPIQPSVQPAEGDTSEVTTPRGTHREHPLGQPIPFSVHATLTYRLW